MYESASSHSALRFQWQFHGGIGVVCILNLGLVQSLNSGALNPSEAIQCFYHADNCLYVREHFQSRAADAIMSRGVQLPDLFEHLPPEEAQRAFFLRIGRDAGIVLATFGGGTGASRLMPIGLAISF